MDFKLQSNAFNAQKDGDILIRQNRKLSEVPNSCHFVFSRSDMLRMSLRPIW
jgi:hypothetical protein